jgi:hypothetical protein
MAARKEHRELGGRYAFLKRRLLQLPQESLTMEVDFCPLPHNPGIEDGFWLGLIVDPHGGSMLMESRVYRCVPASLLARDGPPG